MGFLTGYSAMGGWRVSAGDPIVDGGPDRSSHEHAMSTLPAEASPAIEEIRLIGGDELVRELMSTFLRFAQTQLPRLYDAAEDGDVEVGATIAHTLKASARQLGAIALGDACASAELAAKGGDMAGFLKRTEEVADAFERTRPWMEQLTATPA